MEYASAEPFVKLRRALSKGNLHGIGPRRASYNGTPLKVIQAVSEPCSYPHKKTGVIRPRFLFSQTAAENYIFQLYWMPNEFWYISILSVPPTGKYWLTGPDTSFAKPCI